MPLTPNGKIDRTALPAPEEAGSGLEIVGPRTPIEEMLFEIWAELLRRDGFGVCQNFFELGGHSLLATQVISRVRETFEIDIPLRAVFEAPSVATLAEVMLGDPETRPQVERMAELLVSLSQLSEEELEERLSKFEA